MGKQDYQKSWAMSALTGEAEALSGHLNAAFYRAMQGNDMKRVHRIQRLCEMSGKRSLRRRQKSYELWTEAARS